MSERNELTLTRGGAIYTHSAGDAYLVTRGSVLVCVVPLNRDGRMGLALRVTRVEAGHVIPSLCWKDPDQRQWRLALQTEEAEGASLTLIPHGATLPLKRRFIEGMGIDTWQEEGYEGSLTELYRRQELKNRVFVARSDRERREARLQEQQLVRSALRGRIPPGQLGGDPLYRVTARACAAGRIGIAPQERLEQACEEMSVPEMARVSRFPCRQVVLEGDWYRHDCGVLIGTMDGRPVACVPHGGGYRYWCADMAAEQRLTRAMAARVEPVAWSIGRGLPHRALEEEDLRRFLRESLRPSETARLALWAVLIALAGLLLPLLNRRAFDEYLPMGEAGTVARLAAALAAFLLGEGLLLAARSLLTRRISLRAGFELEAAACRRLLTLPERTLRELGSAGPAACLMTLGPLAGRRVDLGLTALLSGCTGLASLLLMLSLSPTLALTALGLLGMWSAALLLLSRLTAGLRPKGEAERGAAEDRLYQLLAGVREIRMAGAEERAMLEYMLPIAREKQLSLRRGRLGALNLALRSGGATLFALVLFAVAAGQTGLSLGTFIAFLTAFGTLTGAVSGLLAALTDWQAGKSALARCMELLRLPPEDTGTGAVVTGLTGDISL